MTTKARRADGEASIRERGNGTWQVRAYFESLDGRKVRRSFYGATKKEAVAKLKAARDDSARGDGPGGRSQTVKQFLDSWLWHTARPRLKVSTLILYRQLSRHLIAGLGAVPLDKLTVQQVQAFINAKVDGGLSPQTAHNLRALLRTALNHAVKTRLISYNAAALADSPRILDRKPTDLRPDLVPAFMKAAATDELEALYILALSSGLRQGELLALKWTDVDLERGVVSVSRSVRRLRVVPGQPTRLVYGEPKTKSSRRTLPLTSIAIEALRRHRERAMQRALLPVGFVFMRADGSPLEAKHLGHAWVMFLRRAGLPKMRFHDLRHSAATFLLANRVPPRTVMAMMGHASLKTTMEIYGHVHPEMLVDASDTMERLLTV